MEQWTEVDDVWPNNILHYVMVDCAGNHELPRNIYHCKNQTDQ